MTYVAANGSELQNNGEFEVVWTATDNRERKAVFQNAKVEMPIFSMSEMAKDKHSITFEEDGGYVIHKPTGHRYDFIIRSGVYFIKNACSSKPN